MGTRATTLALTTAVLVLGMADLALAAPQAPASPQTPGTPGTPATPQTPAAPQDEPPGVHTVIEVGCAVNPFCVVGNAATNGGITDTAHGVAGAAGTAIDLAQHPEQALDRIVERLFEWPCVPEGQDTGGGQPGGSSQEGSGAEGGQQGTEALPQECAGETGAQAAPAQGEGDASGEGPAGTASSRGWEPTAGGMDGPFTNITQWLLATPNLSGAGSNLSKLESGISVIGLALLGATMTLAVIHFWLGSISLTSVPHGSGAFESAQGLARGVGAALIIALWPWIYDQGISVGNVLMASVIREGFPDLVGNFLTGIGSGVGVALIVTILLSIAVLIALFALVMLKIAMLAILAVLFAGMPLAMALWPLPSMAWVSRLIWRMFTVILAVPVIWALVFAVTRAIGQDAFTLANADGDAWHEAGVFGTLLRPLVFLSLLFMLIAIPVGARRLMTLTALIPGGGGGGGGGAGGTLAAAIPGGQTVAGIAGGMMGGASSAAGRRLFGAAADALSGDGPSDAPSTPPDGESDGGPSTPPDGEPAGGPSTPPDGPPTHSEAPSTPPDGSIDGIAPATPADDRAGSGDAPTVPPDGLPESSPTAPGDGSPDSSEAPMTPPDSSPEGGPGMPADGSTVPSEAPFTPADEQPENGPTAPPGAQSADEAPATPPDESPGDGGPGIPPDPVQVDQELRAVERRHSFDLP